MADCPARRCDQCMLVHSAGLQRSCCWHCSACTALCISVHGVPTDWPSFGGQQWSSACCVQLVS
eukprot:9772557-Lingulodinium_polyedra.AAC.1